MRRLGGATAAEYAHRRGPRGSFNREEYKYSRPTAVVETTGFVAKARIIDVAHNEHDLRPGAIIDTRYKVAIRTPPAPLFRGNTATLKVGETVALTVFRHGSSFEWRN